MLRDLVCAAVLFCVAIAYYAAANDISRSTLADEVGAQGLPVVYALALAAVALLLAAKSLLALALLRAPVQAPTPDAPRTASRLRRASGLLAIGVAYIVLVPLLGYLAAIAVTLAATAVYEGERPGLKLGLIAAAGAVCLWLLFDRLLGIGMPAFAAW
jgi:hypothetical protein